MAVRIDFVPPRGRPRATGAVLPMSPRTKGRATAAAAASVTPGSPRQQQHAIAAVLPMSPRTKGSATAAAAASVTPGSPRTKGSATAAAAASVTPGSPRQRQHAIAAVLPMSPRTQAAQLVCWNVAAEMFFNLPRGDGNCKGECGFSHEKSRIDQFLLEWKAKGKDVMEILATRVCMFLVSEDGKTGCDGNCGRPHLRTNSPLFEDIDAFIEATNMERKPFRAVPLPPIARVLTVPQLNLSRIGSSVSQTHVPKVMHHSLMDMPVPPSAASLSADEHVPPSEALLSADEPVPLSAASGSSLPGFDFNVNPTPASSASVPGAIDVGRMDRNALLGYLVTNGQSIELRLLRKFVQSVMPSAHP
jgi:hypothetical protein